MIQSLPYRSFPKHLDHCYAESIDVHSLVNLMSTALNCSGAWKPGVPACSVLVPIALVEDITLKRPKSVRYTWLSDVSTYYEEIFTSILDTSP